MRRLYLRRSASSVASSRSSTSTSHEVSSRAMAASERRYVRLSRYLSSRLVAEPPRADDGGSISSRRSSSKDIALGICVPAAFVWGGGADA